MFLLCLMSLLSGCSDKPDARLLSAQKDMDINPDSIANKLLSIDTLPLPRHDKALYYLLLTQSLHKSNRLGTDATQINSALDYYIKRGDKWETMMAHFYASAVLRNASDTEGAMGHALLAHEISRDLEDSYWIAKTAEGIADLYSLSYLYKDAWEYEEEAIIFYQKANKTDNHLYALADHGLSLYYGGKPDNGIQLCDSVLRIAKDNDMGNLNIYASKYLFYMLLDKKDYRQASTIYSNITRNIDMSTDSYFNSEAALMFMGLRDTNSAVQHFKIAHEEMESAKDSLAFYSNALLFENNDEEKRASYLDTILYLQNKNVNEALRQPLYKSSSDYYLNGLTMEKYKAKTNLILFIILSCFLIAILVIIYLYSRQKLREKENLFMELRINYDDIKSKEDKLSSFIIELLGSRFDTINKISTDFVNGVETPLQKKLTLEHVEKELKSWSTSKRLKKIEEALNTYLDNVCEKLRSQCDFLNDEEIKLIIYFWAGFSPTTISMLLPIKIKTIYTNRSRIIKKIEKSGMPDKKIFLRLFGKDTSE